MMGLLFLVPMMALLCVFQYYPIMQCIVQSFFQYKVTDMPGTFVGISNYVSILSSDLFSNYLTYTLILYLYLILFSFIVPIFQSLMVFQLTRTRGLAR